MSEKLLPCPFCGCTETTQTTFRHSAWIECSECRMYGPSVAGGIEKAIAAWNQRAQPAGEAASWFAVAMNAAAYLEDAANCLKDADAERAARGAAEHVRKRANELWVERAKAAGEAEKPVAWHIGNADGSINNIGAVYIRRSLAEKHIASYEPGEIDARIVPLYAAPVPKRKPLEAFVTVAEWAAQGAAAWIVDVPDEPELGHWFAEESAGEGYRSRPLYLAAPKAPCHPAIECCGKEPCALAAPPAAANQAGIPEGELRRLRRIAWLIGSIFVHGNFVAETYNERQLEKLLREQGTFWDTLSEFDAAAPHE